MIVFVDKIGLYPIFFGLRKIKDTSNKKGTKIIRDKIYEVLLINGWSNPVRVSSKSKITVTSIYKKIGLCCQFGNVSRLNSDMLKLQLLYKKGVIDAAIYIVPTNQFAVNFGSSRANFERFTNELEVFAQIINVPIIVLGVEGE